MEINLITSFFNDQMEYIDFLTSKERLAIANEDGNCIADLHKTTANFWTYKLSWTDGKYVSEFIRPFTASNENIATFNAGCKHVAEQLQVYIETNDPHAVPMIQNTFGSLTYNFPVCPMPRVWNEIYTALSNAYNKNPNLPPPPKPLILDGWHYSNDAEKKVRWLNTVYWILDYLPEKRILDDIGEDDYYKPTT
jgi:hypothetical protein